MAVWQTIVYIVTTLAFIFSIGKFIQELKHSREERALGTFLRLLDFYGNIMAERRRVWGIIKEKVRADPKISAEIKDRTGSVDYLLTRVKQAEHFFSIEHQLLENEIRALNILNELCKIALEQEQMALILKVCYSNEISFYQNRLKDILSILDKERQVRLFSIPRYSYLQKLQTADYFQDLNETLSSNH